MILWTKCPECGENFSGRGEEAAQKLFAHRLLHHDEWTDYEQAKKSMTETMQDVSVLKEPSEAT